MEQPNPQIAREPDQVVHGMRCLDTSRDTKVAVLMEMVGALSRATEPTEVLQIFADGWGKIHEIDGYISLSTRGLQPGEYRITRLITDINQRDLLATDPWSKTQSIQVHTGGFLGEMIRSAYPEVIHALDVPDDPVLGNALAPFCSLMAIPLFDNGEPLNWAIMLHHGAEGFTRRDLEESIMRGNLAGGTVKNKILTRQLQAAHQTIQREVDQIATIQRSLLPDPLPAIAGLTIEASYETYDQAGGDYYDFVPLRYTEKGQPDPHGLWGILIADASGHGPSAAVVMAMLHAILHAHPDKPNGPGEVLEHANRHLSAKRIESSFVTAFFGIYDPAERRLTYARAGHNPPMLKHSGVGGSVRQLDEVGGIPLGIFADETYEEASLQLEPGQTVLLYTDGITEAIDPSGRMFGQSGVETALTRCSGNPGCVRESLSGAIRRHENGVRPLDDQTFVALCVDPD